MNAAPGPASEASASGRTFDGPQPKRPSAGLIESGRMIWDVSVTPPVSSQSRAVLK